MVNPTYQAIDALQYPLGKSNGEEIRFFLFPYQLPWRLPQWKFSTCPFVSSIHPSVFVCQNQKQIYSLLLVY